jgi:hypothetical protein
LNLLKIQINTNINNNTTILNDKLNEEYDNIIELLNLANNQRISNIDILYEKVTDKELLYTQKRYENIYRTSFINKFANQNDKDILHNMNELSRFNTNKLKKQIEESKTFYEDNILNISKSIKYEYFIDPFLNPIGDYKNFLFYIFINGVYQKKSIDTDIFYSNVGFNRNYHNFTNNYKIIKVFSSANASENNVVSSLTL